MVKFLWMVRIEPGAAGWEASMLPLCYRALSKSLLNIKWAFVNVAPTSLVRMSKRSSKATIFANAVKLFVQQLVGRSSLSKEFIFQSEKVTQGRWIEMAFQRARRHAVKAWMKFNFAFLHHPKIDRRRDQYLVSSPYDLALQCKKIALYQLGGGSSSHRLSLFCFSYQGKKLVS